MSDQLVDRNRLWSRLDAAVAALADPAVTEIAAGSGLLVPGIVDHYAAFEPRPAAFFGVRVSRRPALATATVRGGDLVWFRHAKSGELFEHVRDVHLVRGESVTDVVPSYRGCERAF